MLDGYTTTNKYPYSQNADTQQVAAGSSLPGSYNYVRNSVKVVINAYSGKMTFYDVDPSDPILQAYEAAFPHMFTPALEDERRPAGPPALPRGHLLHPVRHLRPLPPDLTIASSTTDNGAWQLSPTAGAGPSRRPSRSRITFNQQGQLISTSPARMAPLVPGAGTSGLVQRRRSPSPTPTCRRRSRNASASNNQNLRAFMMGTSDPGDYGQLTVYQTPQGTPGPANADSVDPGRPAPVSKDITLLDQHGSEVLLGNTLMVPVGNPMVYLRPLYVASSTNPLPQLTYVIGVFGQKVVVDRRWPGP